MYCVKVVEKTPFHTLSEKIEEYSLEDFEEISWNDGYKCAWFELEKRHIVICTDGERIRFAYTVRC